MECDIGAHSDSACGIRFNNALYRSTAIHGFLMQNNYEPANEAMTGVRLSSTDSFQSLFHYDFVHENPVSAVVIGASLLILLFSIAWVVRENKRAVRAAQELKLGCMAFLHAPYGILITDENNLILRVNSAFTLITGYSGDEVLGKSPGLLSSGDHEKEFYQKLWRTLRKTGKWSGEIVNRHKHGHTFVQKISIVQVRDKNGEVSHHVAIFSDISPYQKLISALQHSANHDLLTGLPNRNLLQDRIRQAVSQARRFKAYVVIILLDLDGFKPVNDTYGHAAGDVLLKKIALRMKEVVREVDTVARLGGDEFVVVLESLRSRESAMRCAEGILAVINQPVDLNRADQTVQVSASLGVLIGEPAAPANSGPSPQQLLEMADELMYQAKREGRARMVVRSLNAEEWLALEAGRTLEKEQLS